MKQFLIFLTVIMFMIGCSKSDNNEECGPGLGYYSTISEA